jgi:acetoin utilization deacetylase AcuC-like enzyme
MLIVTNQQYVKEEQSTSNNKPELRQRKILEALGTLNDKFPESERKRIGITFLEYSTSSSFIISLKKIHDNDYLNFLFDAYDTFTTDNPDKEFKSECGGLIPITFAITDRNNPYLKQELKDMVAWKRVGYYCTDTTTPVGKDTLNKSMISAHVAYCGAEELIKNDYNIVNAQTLFPSHHAGRSFYGGYCYINNIALAAQRISELDNKSNIVILDLDYHAGDGTFDIFANNKHSLNVTAMSIHMNPKYDYPYYRGLEGNYDDGKHTHCYYTLEPKSDIKQYMEKLNKALQKIKEIAPKYLLIAFGADTYKDDPETSPTTGMKLEIADYETIGCAIVTTMKALNGKILVTQEGGYNMDKVGDIVKSFFYGILRT